MANAMFGPEDSRSSTPLRRFIEVKGKINEIYKDVLKLTAESHKFLNGISAASQLVSDEQLSKVEAFSKQVPEIQVVLERNHMKVVFFGRTSNGKSTTINAMLWDKVLPTGFGHTTDCFLSVQGCDRDKGYMSRQNSSNEICLTELDICADALEEERDHGDCQQSSIVHIFWPRKHCHLLMNDLVLLDSPGVDLDQDLDEWIHTHCMDADVFVLVLNAESALVKTEKNFFHKVSEKLSRPNIFILNNKWDVSADAPEKMQAVKRQHLEREIKFLVEELKVMTKTQAKDRVFFVSAKEALNTRIPKTLSTPDANSFVEGYQARLREFGNFERKLKECVSQTAVRTKFEQHAKQGRQIVDYTQEILSQVLEAATKKRVACIEKCNEQNKRLDDLNGQMKVQSLKSEKKIEDVSEYLKSKVSATMTDVIEIEKLKEMVNDFKFSEPFQPELLAAHKKELQKHVEASLDKNLNEICSADINRSVDEAQTEMTERMYALVHMDSSQREEGHFVFSYSVNCQDFLADFKENIDYQGFFLSQLASPINPIIAVAASRLPKAVIGHTTVLVSGALTVVYAYDLYKRARWTKRDMERVFREQFAAYASYKLKTLVSSNSSNLSYQIQQNLSGAFARLSLEVESSKQSLEKEIVDIEVETKRLEGLITKAKLMRDEAASLGKKLESFIKQYFQN